MKNITFIYILQHGVKIGEMGGQVTGTMKLPLFASLAPVHAHTYKIKSDETI